MFELNIQNAKLVKGTGFPQNVIMYLAIDTRAHLKVVLNTSLKCNDVWNFTIKSALMGLKMRSIGLNPISVSLENQPI